MSNFNLESSPNVRNGSINEVLERVNYLEHVRENPTKNFSEAVDYLYEELDNLETFFSNGISDQDIEIINSPYALHPRLCLNRVSSFILDRMAQRYSLDFKAK